MPYHRAQSVPYRETQSVIYRVPQIATFPTTERRVTSRKARSDLPQSAEGGLRVQTAEVSPAARGEWPTEERSQ